MKKFVIIGITTFFIILIIIVLSLVFTLVVKPKNNLNENLQNYSNETNEPIDIVYTWAGPQNGADIRTKNYNELEHSIEYTLHFMPWVRYIHVLMNEPVFIPDFAYKYNGRVKFVGHNQVYKNPKHLGSKNSNSIETVLHNIPGLAEHFIYFNDDLFVIKPVGPNYFFKNGKPIVVDAKIIHQKDIVDDRDEYPGNRRIKIPPMYTGFYPHIPIPLLKSQLELFEITYSDYINFIRTFKTRKGPGCDVCSHYDLSCPCQQMQIQIAPFMLKNGAAIPTEDVNLHSTCKDNPNYINTECIDKLNTYPQSLDKNNSEPFFIVVQTTIIKPEMEKGLNAFYKRMSKLIGPK